MEGPASRWALAAGLLVGLSFGGPAFGAGPKGAPAVDPRAEEARQHYGAGEAAAEMGNWAKARDAFSSAWEAKPHYKIAWALASAEIELGKYRDATAHLEACLSMGNGMAPAEREEVTAMLADTRARLATLRIKLEVTGADILVDGERVGTSPLDGDVVVDPGQRRIVAWKQGVKFVPVARSLKPGATVDVSIMVEQRPAPPRAPEDKDTNGGGWKPWAIAGGTTVAAAGIVTGVAMMAFPSDSHSMEWAVGAFALGGVATFATIAMALAPTKKKRTAPKSGLWVAPVVGGRENGVWVGGSF